MNANQTATETPVLGVATWFLPSRGITGLRWAKDAGFGLVHFDRYDVEAITPSQLAGEASRLDVTLGGLAAIDIEKLGPTGQATRDCVNAALDLAHKLNVAFVYIPAFGAAEITSTASMTQMAQLLTQTLRAAEGSGITIATENTLGVGAQLDLFERVNDDRLQLLFDTQNPTLRGHHPPDIATELADRIRSYVHVKDGADAMGNRRIGEGTAHVQQSLAAILDSGFDVTLVLENDYRSGDLADARTDQLNVHTMTQGRKPKRSPNTRAQRRFQQPGMSPGDTASPQLP